MLTVVVWTIMGMSIALFLVINLSVLFIHYPHWGISVHETRTEYWRLLYYLQVPWPLSLNLKQIPVSSAGIHHFAAVRHLFLINDGLGLISTAASWRLIKKLRQQRDFWYFPLPLKLVMLILLILATIALVDFPSFFVASHFVLFNDHNWVFSVSRDPIILLMPVEFFTKLFTLWVGLVFFFLFIFWGWIYWHLRFLKLWTKETNYSW